MADDQARACSTPCPSPWSRWSTTSPSTSAAPGRDLLAGDDALMPPGYYALHRAASWLRTRRHAARRRAAAPSSTASPPPAAPARSCAGMVQTLFDRLLPARPGENAATANPSTALLDAERLRPRAARADPRRPAQRPHRPGAEPAAGQHRHRRRAARTTCSTPRAALADGTARRWAWQALRRGRGRRGHAGRRASAAAGRRARAWSRRCTRSASWAASTAPSSRSTWPRAGASAAQLRHAHAARHHHQLPDPRADRRRSCAAQDNYGYAGPLLLSPGRAIGLRLVPMARDLRFAWEEMPQQTARRAGAEGAREPARRADRLGAADGRGQRLHRQPARCSACTRSATGTRSPTCSQRRAGAAAGTSARSCKYLMLHNIDTLGRRRRPGAARPAHRAAARR